MQVYILWSARVDSPDGSGIVDAFKTRKEALDYCVKQCCDCSYPEDCAQVTYNHKYGYDDIKFQGCNAASCVIVEKTVAG